MTARAVAALVREHLAVLGSSVPLCLSQLADLDVVDRVLVKADACLRAWVHDSLDAMSVELVTLSDFKPEELAQYWITFLDEQRLHSALRVEPRPEADEDLLARQLAANALGYVRAAAWRTRIATEGIPAYLPFPVRDRGETALGETAPWGHWGPVLRCQDAHVFGPQRARQRRSGSGGQGVLYG